MECPPDFLLEDSQSSSVCPDASDGWMKKSRDDLWNDADGNTEVFEEQPVSVSLCSLQISHGLTWIRTWASRFEVGH